MKPTQAWGWTQRPSQTGNWTLDPLDMRQRYLAQYQMHMKVSSSLKLWTTPGMHTWDESDFPSRSFSFIFHFNVSTVTWLPYICSLTFSEDIFVLLSTEQLFTPDTNLILAERQHSFAWLAVLPSSHTPTDMHLICHQHPKSYLNTARNFWVNVPVGTLKQRGKQLFCERIL